MNISESNRKIIELACNAVGTTELVNRMRDRGINVTSQELSRFKYGQRVRQTELSNAIIRSCRTELRKLYFKIDEQLKKAEI